MAVNHEELAKLEAMTRPISEEATKKARKFGSTKSADDYLENMMEELQDDFIEDNVIAPPTPTAAMFYGFVGKVAMIAADGTEINPVAASMVMLSFLGANVGADTFYRIGDKVHHPLLFTLHIGRSGRGRKGDSQQLIQRIRHHIEAREKTLLGQTHTGGLSTREGLAAMMHDGYGETPAIQDKRLWVIESEFANVLHQTKREGNTLSSALREIWDGGDIKPATKSNKISATAPHVGIHGNITPAELNGLLKSREMSNGFANRFLMIWAEKTRSIAEPKPTEDAIVEELAINAMEIIRHAKGGYPNRRNGQEMQLSKAARDFWVTAYVELDRPLESDLHNELLQRRAPYVIRLAMLFAMTDRTRVIEVCHLKAALAWVHYSMQTVKFVFSEAANDQRHIETQQNAAKILRFLKLRPNGASKKDLVNDCFQKNSAGKKIDDALIHLLSEHPPKIEQTEVRNGRRGPLTKRYLLKNSTDCFSISQTRAISGLEGNKSPTDSLRTVTDCFSENENSPLLSVNDENGLKPDMTRLTETKKQSVHFFNSANAADAENIPLNAQKTGKMRGDI